MFFFYLKFIYEDYLYKIDKLDLKILNNNNLKFAMSLFSLLNLLEKNCSYF